MQSVKE